MNRLLLIILIEVWLVSGVIALSKNPIPHHNKPLHSGNIKQHSKNFRHNLNLWTVHDTQNKIWHNEDTDTQAFYQCSKIKYSNLVKNDTTDSIQCICPQSKKRYNTTDGQKCLSPELSSYPQFVQIACGISAALVPVIVAILCRHRQEEDDNQRSQINKNQIQNYLEKPRVLDQSQQNNSGMNRQYQLVPSNMNQQNRQNSIQYEREDYLVLHSPNGEPQLAHVRVGRMTINDTMTIQGIQVNPL